MTAREGRPAHTANSQTIAFLLDYAPKTWCSREDYHVGLCEALAARGISSVLVFAKELPPELSSLLHEKGIATEVIDYGRGVAHYHKELGRVVRKYSVTAAHICYFDYFSMIAWLARLNGVRTIVYEAVNSGIFTARSWKRVLLQLRNLGMTKPLSRVIAISDFVKKQLVAGGLSPHMIDVRHLGIDHNRFVPAADARVRFRSQFGVSPDEVVLATVSFLNPFKNPQTIIEACGLLARKGLHYRLFVAGDGVLRQELEIQSRTLGIDDRVTWLGHLGDPRQLLQASDVFVLASVGEAFGFVLPEAMACGLPIVATRSGAIGEIVQDGETGLLVPPRDSAAFAAALTRMIEDEGLRKSMGARGLVRARERFTIQVVVRNTMQFYESIGLTEKAD